MKRTESVTSQRVARSEDIVRGVRDTPRLMNRLISRRSHQSRRVRIVFLRLTQLQSAGFVTAAVPEAFITPPAAFPPDVHPRPGRV